MLESQEIPGVTPIQQKKALEADSILDRSAFRGKSVSQTDLPNNSALVTLTGRHWFIFIQNSGLKG